VTWRERVAARRRSSHSGPAAAPSGGAPAERAADGGAPAEAVARRAKDATLVLHIGLHKTASSFVQNTLSTQRYDLLQQGVLYPMTGANKNARPTTREGAQSGQALFTRTGDRSDLVAELIAELPASAHTVLLSSEDFTRLHGSPTASQVMARFSAFGAVKVILVLRRQDTWLESLYKQLVDQYGNFEVRSFDHFVRDLGSSLVDFHARFSEWRELVGPENFHVLSYDDLPDGAALHRRMLEIAGVTGEPLDGTPSVPVPHYTSVRAVDTLGLRVLNSYRLADRNARTRIAKAIYEAAPAGDLQLMSPELRQAIHDVCAPINERIEAEWFDHPVPGFRFGTPVRESGRPEPSGAELAAYLDRVLALCEEARAAERESGAEPGAAT
jgi:hypothetical protein